MASHRQSLREEIDRLPVVDAHEHLNGHVSGRSFGVTDFIISAYLSSIFHFADSSLAERVLDTSRADRERWSDFCRIWPLVRALGYGNMVLRMLRAWGVDENLSAKSYDIVQKQIEKRSPETGREAYKKAGIEHTITHYLGHPSFGGIKNVEDFFAGSLTFDPGFHPLLGTLPLHEFFTSSDVEAVGHLGATRIGCLDDLVEAIEAIIARAVSAGVVGLKDHAAYTRGLAFGSPDKLEAERELKHLLIGEKFEQGARLLSNFLFQKIIDQSVEHGIPMVIHTGYLVGSADPKANLRHFAPIIEANPEARFDLYHLNYPWFDDLFSVLKRFPNTWANCCWTHVIDPAGTVQFLQRALCTVPSNHIFGFGGDFSFGPEPVLAHLEIAKDNICMALTSAINNGWCSKSTATEVARLWLYENPKTFYGV